LLKKVTSALYPEKATFLRIEIIFGVHHQSLQPFQVVMAMMMKFCHVINNHYAPTIAVTKNIFKFIFNFLLHIVYQTTNFFLHRFLSGMQIHNSVTFTSRANPVKPFIIYTSKGMLHFKEPSMRRIHSRGFIKNLAMFFCKNFASLTNDPFWKPFGKAKLSKEYKQHFKAQVAYFKKILHSSDDDITLLLATDKKNKIQGAILSFGFEDVPGCKKSVYYIEDLAVNPKYRKNGIGKVLIEKTLDSVKNVFTDAFLTGEVLAEGFYKRLGFNHLNPADAAQKSVIDYLAKIREDFPNYVSFLTKPLQQSKPRWYNTLDGKLDK